MSMAATALCSSNLSFKNPVKLSSHTRTHDHLLKIRSSLKKSQPVNLNNLRNFSGPSSEIFGCSINRKMGFILKAENGDGERESQEQGGDPETRGESTMPERFRYLTKEAPDKPVRWPWFVALAFMIYAWRAVFWELSNWKKAAGAILKFLGYISKLALALLFHFIGDPITFLIRSIETTLYTVRAFYSGVVAYAPIPELTTVIFLASTVFAVAEATSSDSVNSQPYLLTFAGLASFAAVTNYISELFFWVLLLGMFGFARFVRKRDYVSSTLPVAAVLAAVGEPWIRVVAISLYLALAIVHHSKHADTREAAKDAGTVRRIPFPLLCAALAIGVRVAAKWAGYRHLTWMIV